MNAPIITLALQALQEALQGIRTQAGYRTDVCAVYRGRAALNIERPLAGIILTIHNVNDEPIEGNDPSMEYQEHIRSIIIEALVPISDAYDDEIDALLDDIRRILAIPLTAIPLEGYTLSIETGNVSFIRPEADIAVFQLPVRISYFLNLSNQG